MERFIDRSAEMETLQSEYERNGSALVVLYGRRRVGKSTLISKFIKDKPALFFAIVANLPYYLSIFWYDCADISRLFHHL